jgi:hypothetical protein
MIHLNIFTWIYNEKHKIEIILLYPGILYILYAGINCTFQFTAKAQRRH